MSTHCGIAIKTENDYKTIYCHNSGSQSYMLPMLTENYNSEELANKLVSLGDASCIYERLEPTAGHTHNFDKREPGVCVFYYRDRGEFWDDVAPMCFTKQELFDNFYYSYVWENDCWNLYTNSN